MNHMDAKSINNIRRYCLPAKTPDVIAWRHTSPDIQIQDFISFGLKWTTFN